VIEAFQAEMQEALSSEDAQIPQISLLLEQKLQALKAEDREIFLKKPELPELRQFTPLQFERLSPYNKLAYAVQKIFQNQELMLTNAKTVHAQTKQYFDAIELSDRVVQVEQSVMSLRAGIADLKAHESVVNENERQVHAVYMRHMSELKRIQQQLQIIKGHLQVQQGLQQVKLRRSILNTVLPISQDAKPRLNLLTKQQVIRVFNDALDKHPNYEDFIDFFNN